MSKNNQLPWGISLALVGIIFLLKKLNLLTPELETLIFNWRNLLLLFGVIFLISHKNRSIGVILLLIWAANYLKNIISWSMDFSEILWPLLLIVAGAFLIIQSFSKKKR